jgi:hypothetical protein
MQSLFSEYDQDESIYFTESSSAGTEQELLHGSRGAKKTFCESPLTVVRNRAPISSSEAQRGSYKHKGLHLKLRSSHVSAVVDE